MTNIQFSRSHIGSIKKSRVLDMLDPETRKTVLVHVLDGGDIMKSMRIARSFFIPTRRGTFTITDNVVVASVWAHVKQAATVRECEAMLIACESDLMHTGSGGFGNGMMRRGW